VPITTVLASWLIRHFPPPGINSYGRGSPQTTPLCISLQPVSPYHPHHEKILLSDILTPSVKTVPPHTSITEDAEEMASMGISCIVAGMPNVARWAFSPERDAVHLLAERRGMDSLKIAM